MSTVPYVPNKRGVGQKLITFYVPEAEREAFMDAVRANGETATAVLRKAAANYVKRVEKKREAGQ